jgi:hypothetical protein
MDQTNVFLAIGRCAVAFEKRQRELFNVLDQGICTMIYLTHQLVIDW